MAQGIYRLEPRVTNALTVFRNGQNLVRDLEVQYNKTREEIQSRELWLNSNPLDHPDRVQVENDLANLKQSLTQVCNDHEMIRQNVNLLQSDLYECVVNSSNLRSNFPFSFLCETVEDIDAVHTLMNSIVVWPDGYVFRIGIRRSSLRPSPPSPPPVPFEVLFHHADRLHFEIVSLP